MPNENIDLPGGPPCRAEQEAIARRQSLLVPWKQFETVLGEYVEWALYCCWARYVYATAGGISTDLAANLARKVRVVPDEASKNNLTPDQFCVCLIEAVEKDHFQAAKEVGFLFALRWYAAESDLIAKAVAWMQNHESATEPSSSIVPFERWREAVISIPAAVEPGSPGEKILPKRRQIEDTVFQSALQQYLEHYAFVYWIRAVESADDLLPPLGTAAIRERYPGFDVDRAVSTAQDVWLELLEHIERTAFASAGDWLHVLRFYAHRDLRQQRLAAYSAACEARWMTRRPKRLPDFHAWQLRADDYTKRRRNPGKRPL